VHFIGAHLSSLTSEREFLFYREDFYFVEGSYCSAVHGDWCTVGCKTRMNFANESACLMADNIRSEVHGGLLLVFC
jgi:hypothetical protein